MQWMVESERVVECLGQHDWWQRHPNLLRETVRRTAERLAAAEGKGVYQQHVLRAAAAAAEETNNAIYARRSATDKPYASSRPLRHRIPDRAEAMPVILDSLGDGRTMSSEEIAEAIVVHFRLTAAERTYMRGPHPEYRNETAFALVRLQVLGYIEKPDPERLSYRITDSGRHARQHVREIR